MVYDPVRDRYMMMYQAHAQHFEWGRMSWGQAVSTDMVTWTDFGNWTNQDFVALNPPGNGSFNGLGIFSGTAQPVNLTGDQDGTLLIFYTAIHHLPFAWDTPYQRGTETQAYALSHDGGGTWEFQAEPVISSPPDGWDVVGWRDPFFEPFPALDRLLKYNTPHYYTVYGAGLKDLGSRMPLYSAPANDLSSWTFLGALWEATPNGSLSTVQETGTWAYNFEVANFFDLVDNDGERHFYATMASQGNVTWPFHNSVLWSLWHEGDVSVRSNGSVAFDPKSGGATDWGILYAVTSFNDTKKDRRLQYGWAPEDYALDSNSFGAKQQGFAGALSLPRELFVHKVYNIVNAMAGTSGNAVMAEASASTFTARTLGMRPARDIVLGLREGAHATVLPAATYTASTMLISNATTSYELNMTISASKGMAGIRLAVAPDESEFTTISWHPANESIVVDRSRSTTLAGFNKDVVTGFFRPYVTTTGVEPVNWHIFVDGSLVEIFVNERFALTTRIYTAALASTGLGIYVAPGSSITVESGVLYMGLKNAWPNRPANSSSPLLYDSDAETNGRLWWSGL